MNNFVVDVAFIVYGFLIGCIFTKMLEIKKTAKILKVQEQYFEQQFQDMIDMLESEDEE